MDAIPVKRRGWALRMESPASSSSSWKASARGASLPIVAGIVFLLSACAALEPVAPPEVSSARDAEIVILHTNDVHGNIRPLKGTWIRRDTPPLVGGTASLSTFVKGWSARRGGDTGVLLLDAGDFFQGTPEGNNSKGRLMIELMNRLGYDAAALGNHEFDFGMENLREILRLARFPVMAENAVDRRTGRKPVELSAPVIIEQDGVRIGLAGLLTEELAKVAAVDPIEGWTVSDEVRAAAAAAIELRRRGADLVVIISHCDVDRDSVIAATYRNALPAEIGVPAIDLIVGGHSHTRLDTPLVVGGVRIVQTGGRGTAPGEVRISWDRANRRIRHFNARIVELVHDTYPEDPEIASFLSPHYAEIDRSMNRVVGRAPEGIDRRAHRGISSPLGNLQTDLVRAAGRAEIAINNKGGIRADIERGEVTFRDLYVVSPFGNTVVTMKLTGAQVRSLLEKALDGHHTTFEISGMTVRYDMSRPVGSRVGRVTVEGVPLDEARLYTVATNSFLGGGGDAYSEFREGKDSYDTGRTLLEIQVDHFERNPGGVFGVDEMRWIAEPGR